MKSVLVFCFFTLLGVSGFAEFRAHEGFKNFEQNKSQVSPTGVIQVQSIYANELDRKTIEVIEQGTANLVRIKGDSDSTFVITAAHLIGGRDPKIFVGNREIRVIGSLVDNDLDFALLEIEKSNLPPALDYHVKDRRFGISKELQKSNAQRNAVQGTKLGPQTVLVAFSYNDWSNRHSTTNRLYDLVLPPWMDGPMENFNYLRGLTEDPAHSAEGLSWNMRRMKIRMKVPGGVSGSIVFDWSSLFAGIVTDSNYYFGDTELVSAKSVVEFFESYKKGDRGLTSSTQWKMRNGLTYRTFEGGWSEASFSSGRTGVGVTGGTGGHGVNGDTGKGVAGDTGTSPSSFSPWLNKSPNQIFAHYHLDPGMELNGKSLIGILAIAKKKEGRRYPPRLFLYADQSSLEFMRQNDAFYDFQMIEKDSDLIRLLYRVKNKNQNEKFQLWGLTGPGKEFSFDPEYKEFAFERQWVLVDQDQIKIHMVTFSGTNENALTDRIPDDSVDFVLNRQGIPLGSQQKTFLPIIEVKGHQTGKTYFVDIRKIFFNDLSLVKLPFNDKDPKQNINEVNRQLMTTGLIMRNEQSGLEFEFTFQEQ